MCNNCCCEWCEWYACEFCNQFVDWAMWISQLVEKLGLLPLGNPPLCCSKIRIKTEFKCAVVSFFLQVIVTTGKT